MKTDGNSGNPQKNRGICLDGVMDGVVVISNIMLRPTTTADIWFFSWPEDEGTTCTLCDKDTVLDFGINFGSLPGNTMVTTMASHSSTGPIVQSSYVNFETWHNLVYSYQDEGGKDTEAKYFIDGAMVRSETFEGQLILDNTSHRAYLGAFYDGHSFQTGLAQYINKCNACFYDFLVTQTTYTPGGPTDRTTDPDSLPEFWDVPVDQYVDENGIAQDCHPNCTSGCVDGNDCDAIDCEGDNQYCYLCHDRECS